MSKTAVFPGSFDPITNGHMDIITRAKPLFDQLIIATGNNSQKNYLFSLEQRVQWLENLFASDPEITFEAYDGLTIDFCKTVNAKYIIRGLRNQGDFEFERSIAQMNRKMDPEIETIFFMTSPDFSAYSSTIVRDIIMNGGDASAFIPEELHADCRKMSLEKKINQ